MKVAPHFQRADTRAEFERSRNAVRTMLADAAPDDALRAFVIMENDFDAGVFKMKPDLLGSVLCW